MWTCQNCGYTDETGDSFEEELDDDGEVLRYCPECGSDEVQRNEDDESEVDEDSFYPDASPDLKWGKGGDREEEW